MRVIVIITGDRVAHILQLEGVHIKWTAEYVTVNFRSTKNRKSPDKRSVVDCRSEILKDS